MKSVSVYFNFDGNTREAFSFYSSVFGGDVEVLRYRDMGGDEMGITEEELDLVANAGLTIADNVSLMGTDILRSQGQTLTVGNNYYVTLECDDADQANRYFDALTAGGEVEMPLSPTSWAELYGAGTDRFGIQWMVMYTGDVEFGGGASG